jgi:hemerythrin-like domain-containing protein
MIQIGAPSATIDSPVEHLVACHRRIEQRLDTLIKAASHLESDRASAFAAIAKSLEFLDSSGALHTEDEEHSVFPRLREQISGEQIAYLDSLELQHGDAESILSRLKELIDEAARQDPVSGALIEQYRECAESLRSLYRSHIRSEDEILTALAKRFLTAPQLAEISREMRERRA